MTKWTKEFRKEYMRAYREKRSPRTVFSSEMDRVILEAKCTLQAALDLGITRHAVQQRRYTLRGHRKPRVELPPPEPVMVLGEWKSEGCYMVRTLRGV